MIKHYFKQALAQLRQHPLISVISIAGTALSIFLIMLVVMLQQVKVAPFSPESNRDRFLHVHYMSISHKDWGDGTSNGPMSVRTAREIYKSLKPLKLSLFIAVCRYRLLSHYPLCRLLERMCGKRMILFLKCSIFVL